MFIFSKGIPTNAADCRGRYACFPNINYKKIAAYRQLIESECRLQPVQFAVCGVSLDSILKLLFGCRNSSFGLIFLSSGLVSHAQRVVGIN